MPPDTPGAVRIVGTLYDGTGATVPDGLVETWQADPDGRFDHSDDPRGASAQWAERGFTGFARASTVDGGSFEIVTVKPGRLPFGDGRRQAPHLDVSVFARGMLDRTVTRIYFPDEPRPTRPTRCCRPWTRSDGTRWWPWPSRTARCGSTSTSRASMRPSSSPSERPYGGLLGHLPGDPSLDEVVGDRALVAAMLRAEGALATAQAEVGLAPDAAARLVARRRRRGRLRPRRARRRGGRLGQPRGAAGRLARPRRRGAGRGRGRLGAPRRHQPGHPRHGPDDRRRRGHRPAPRAAGPAAPTHWRGWPAPTRPPSWRAAPWARSRPRPRSGSRSPGGWRASTPRAGGCATAGRGSPSSSAARSAPVRPGVRPCPTCCPRSRRRPASRARCRGTRSAAAWSSSPRRSGRPSRPAPRSPPT